MSQNKQKQEKKTKNKINLQVRFSWNQSKNKKSLSLLLNHMKIFFKEKIPFVNNNFVVTKHNLERKQTINDKYLGFDTN